MQTPRLYIYYICTSSVEAMNCRTDAQALREGQALQSVAGRITRYLGPFCSLELRPVGPRIAPRPAPHAPHSSIRWLQKKNAMRMLL